MQLYTRNRMLFMFFVMFPVLLIADYTGNNTMLFTGIVAGVSSGASIATIAKNAIINKPKADFFFFKRSFKKYHNLPIVNLNLL